MKKLVLKGVCQTLILMMALFLIGIQTITLTFSLLLQSESLVQGMWDTLPAEQAGGQNSAGAASEEQLPSWEAASPGEVVPPEESGSGSLQERLYMLALESPRVLGLFYAGLFVLMALYLLPEAFPAEPYDRASRLEIRVRAGLYLACGISFLIFGYLDSVVALMNLLFAAALGWRVVCSIRKKRTPGRLFIRLLLLVMVIVNLIFFHSYAFLTLGIIALAAFGRIMIFSFSQIRIDILRRIIRKTYASEILLGMVLMIVAFSMILSLLDDGIGSFGDAMWFCFATVTTIGYGDVVSVSPIGRIISVILGLYGIVVVALITSIIVNFYNELKNEAAGNADIPAAGNAGEEVKNP